MKNKTLFILALLFAASCNNEKNKPGEAIQSDAINNGEIVKNELSVEDIQAIEKQAESDPWMTYNAILANDVTKTYIFDFDTQYTYICSLKTSTDNAILTMKESVMSKETKKQIFVPINKENNFTVKVEESKPYKAEIKLKKRIHNDSTETFTLKVYRKSVL